MMIIGKMLTNNIQNQNQESYLISASDWLIGLIGVIAIASEQLSTHLQRTERQKHIAQ